MPPVDPLTTLSREPPKPAGSLDGHGAGDHDPPYRFGRQPRAIATYPFSTRQFARLLVLPTVSVPGGPPCTPTTGDHTHDLDHS